MKNSMDETSRPTDMTVNVLLVPPGYHRLAEEVEVVQLCLLRLVLDAIVRPGKMN
jgi:hypothetical protein